MTERRTGAEVRRTLSANGAVMKTATSGDIGSALMKGPGQRYFRLLDELWDEVCESTQTSSARWLLELSVRLRAAEGIKP